MRTAVPDAGIRGMVAAAGLFVCLGCDPVCVARGTIVDDDGLTGVICVVKLHHRAGEPEQDGSACRSPDVAEGDPDRDVVKLGREFKCATIPGPKGQPLDLSVACDGYEPYRGSPFEWKVEGSTCRSQNMGAISVHRPGREPPSKLNEK